MRIVILVIIERPTSLKIASRSIKVNESKERFKLPLILNCGNCPDSRIFYTCLMYQTRLYLVDPLDYAYAITQRCRSYRFFFHQTVQSVLFFYFLMYLGMVGPDFQDDVMD